MEDLFFNGLVTKSLQPINSEDRYFEGFLTVQVKDKQNEVTIVDELYKVLPVWMDRGAPISDTHSNRIIGKGINYAKTIYKADDGSDYPAIKITGKIYKNYELDNEIWNRIKSGEYKGLSFGGATRSNRTPIVMKDGSVAYALKDLEHYEVAVCKDPAVPLALITDFNPIAKAMAGHTEDHGNGKMVIMCSKFGCYVDKAIDPDQRSAELTGGGGSGSDADKKLLLDDEEKVEKISDPNPEEIDPDKIMQNAESAGRIKEVDYPMYGGKPPVKNKGILSALEGAGEVAGKVGAKAGEQIIEGAKGFADGYSGASEEEEEEVQKAEYLTKPFGGYKDFAACVKANQDKDDPSAYCGYLKHEIEKAVKDWKGTCPNCGQKVRNLKDEKGNRLNERGNIKRILTEEERRINDTKRDNAWFDRNYGGYEKNASHNKKEVDAGDSGQDFSNTNGDGNLGMYKQAGSDGTTGGNSGGIRGGLDTTKDTDTTQITIVPEVKKIPKQESKRTAIKSVSDLVTAIKRNTLKSARTKNSLKRI